MGAVLVCPAGAAAQTPRGRDQMDKNMDPASVTVTGCVAKDGEAGSLMLTHAMKTDEMGKPMAPMAKDAMGKDTMGKDLMTKDRSYALIGGMGIDVHLGHNVEIVGTMAKPTAATGAKPGMADKSMMHDAVTVQTVTMLSAVCP